MTEEHIENMLELNEKWHFIEITLIFVGIMAILVGLLIYMLIDKTIAEKKKRQPSKLTKWLEKKLYKNWLE